MENFMDYKAVIGLETHVQLNTESKIFCECRNLYGAEPNTLTCPVCLGYPGTLPVFNKEVLDKAIMTGLSLNCFINKQCIFDRKNYFYPDLPKGYQITQYNDPVAKEGFVEIKKDDETIRRVGINRVHREEDTGKLIHGEERGKPVSYIDFNRSGTPLLEIVTKPDLETSEEVYLYLTKLKRILKYINVSDCNMEEGSFRCDVNISIIKNSGKLGSKVEIKNLNSFKSVQSAIDYEIDRQIKLIEKNEDVIQETRFWDPKKMSTRSMRVKENEDEYKYFPDPDLTPIEINDEYIQKIKNSLPELQDIKMKRFKEKYELPDYDIDILTESRELAEYYEDAVKNYPQGIKKISNWIMSEVLSVLNEKKIKITEFKVEPRNIAQLIEFMDTGTINGKIAKQVFSIMYSKGEEPGEIIDKLGLKQIINEEEIETIVDEVIQKHTEQVEKYKNGKKAVLSFLVGQVMRETQGKANPELTNRLLREKLGE